jgi:hypothetical protein
MNEGDEALRCAGVDGMYVVKEMGDELRARLFVRESNGAVPIGRCAAAMLGDVDREKVFDTILCRDLVQQSEGLAPIAVLEAIEGFFIG